MTDSLLFSHGPLNPTAKTPEERLSHLQFTDLQKMGRLDPVQGHFGISKTQPQPHGGTAKPYSILLFCISVPCYRLFGRLCCQVGFIRENDKNGSPTFACYSFLTAFKAPPIEMTSPLACYVSAAALAWRFPSPLTLSWASHPRALAALCTQLRSGLSRSWVLLAPGSL